MWLVFRYTAFDNYPFSSPTRKFPLNFKTGHLLLPISYSQEMGATGFPPDCVNTL